MVGLDGMKPYSCWEDTCLVCDQRSSAVVGRNSNVLEDVSADEEVLVAGERIEGAADTCQTCERVEGVEQVDVGHRDCNAAERVLQEEDMLAFFGGRLCGIGLNDGRYERYRSEAGFEGNGTSSSSVDSDGNRCRELVDGDAGDGEVVELCFEVLEVESEVEDVLIAGGGRLGFCFGCTAEGERSKSGASHGEHLAAGIYDDFVELLCL